jgi:hypothetical protein
MVDKLFRRRDKLHTIYTYWQLPQSVQHLQADRQMTQLDAAFRVLLARESSCCAAAPLSNSSTETIQYSLFLIREEPRKGWPTGPSQAKGPLRPLARTINILSPQIPYGKCFVGRFRRLTARPHDCKKVLRVATRIRWNIKCLSSRLLRFDTLRAAIRYTRNIFIYSATCLCSTRFLRESAR